MLDAQGLGMFTGLQPQERESPADTSYFPDVEGHWIAKRQPTGSSVRQARSMSGWASI